MALQRTGQISLSNIAAEKNASTANFSLADQSILGINQFSLLRPDRSAPHSISEFYGYNHTFEPAPQLTSFAASETMLRARAFEACGLATRNTLYHNGKNEWPEVGDTLYTDGFGEDRAGWGATAYGKDQALETNDRSEVTALFMCSGKPGGPGLDKGFE